jgi:group I intron endonuclease
MRKVFIYGLHTLGGPIRYIGQTDKPARRLTQHRKDSADTHKCRWVKKIGSSNVFMTVLHKTTEENADNVEIALLALARQRGFDLCNTSEGGGGAGFGHKINLGKKWSAETKAKMSASMMGKNRGKKRSDETRRKISLSKKGQSHPWTMESRQKMSRSMMGNTSGLGRKVSPETRHKISLAQKGIPRKRWTPERRSMHEAKKLLKVTSV